MRSQITIIAGEIPMLLYTQCAGAHYYQLCQ
jgi:hypothetical protein